METDGGTVRLVILRPLVPAPGVWNLVPRDTSELLCAQVVSTTEHNVALGAEFIQGETYTVLVNGVTETFVAQ